MGMVENAGKTMPEWPKSEAPPIEDGPVSKRLKRGIPQGTTLLDDPNWPRPVGWRILIDPLTPKTVTEAGIIMPQETRTAEMYQNYVGRVVALGPLCYKHAKFGDGAPWCKVGDWVAYGQHAGQSVDVRNQKVLGQIKKKEALIADKIDTLNALSNELRLIVGTAQAQVTKDRMEAKQKEIAALRIDNAKLNEKSEHRLRILNDDEILTVIPNKDAIRIYI